MEENNTSYLGTTVGVAVGTTVGPGVNALMYTMRLLVASDMYISNVTSVIPIPDGL